ncbi:hypothetical protein N2152v2_009961 [Parachlorella kessleri]
MPITSPATAWQRPCDHHLTTQLSSARTGPGIRFQAVVSAACRYPGGYSIAGCNFRGGGWSCKLGWRAVTSRHHSRPCFPRGSHGVATSAARQPSSRGGDSSSNPTQPCPLHACLLRHGITDLAAFSAPKHLAISQGEVGSNVEPKLVAMAAEGLSAKQVARILAAHSSPLRCSYAETFQPNLQLLQQIAAFTNYKPHPKAPHLTAAGKMLSESPEAVARYLSRDPSKVQQLLQWLEGSLGVGLEQLAASSGLCHVLNVPVGAASAFSLSLQQQQVPAGQVVHMLLRQPTAFRLTSGLMSARLGTLQQHLGLDAAAALQVAIAHPTLLTHNMEASLPPLLRFLDGYMGEEGAGRRLVRAQPTTAALTAPTAERSIGNLAALGYSQQQIRVIVWKHPGLLSRDLDSPLQQQKLGWIESVSPWTLDDFLDKPSYLTVSTRRLAARLALLRECGLLPPESPGSLATPSSNNFLAAVRQRLARQGQELPWATWAEWEEAWLGREDGREWGFPPLKE